MKAFVLGAGLGTRLQPLTEWLPKPLVPVYHRPLINYAFDHLKASIPKLEGWVVNTHHCPEAYEAAFPQGTCGELPIAFRHEPVLLETAGGIANVADLLEGDRFMVYNGDILGDLPLEGLIASHQREGNEVTLLLRSQGPGLHIGLQHGSQRIVDIRGMVGNAVDQHYQFTGIYLVEGAFLERLTPGKKESVIPIFLDMIRRGDGLGGWVEDRAHWWDLGDESTYRRVHADLPLTGFPRYDPKRLWRAVDPSATLDPSAFMAPDVVVGPGSSVGAGARLEDAVLWPGAQVDAKEQVRGRVVRGERAFHFKHFFPSADGAPPV